MGWSSTRWNASSTIEKCEGGGNTSSNGRAPLTRHGNRRQTCLDVWSCSEDTSKGLESLGAFSRLGSPVKSSGGTPEDLLGAEDPLGPKDKTGPEWTQEDPEP